MPLRRAGRAAGLGRLPSLGHDFDRGHREYVSRLTPGGVIWLHTKPFSAPPSFELATCLRTFAHIIDELDLGLRAQVLDVGCGPGWLSEFLARCGYWVTGIDISEDMVAIARQRVGAIGEWVGEGVAPLAEFHALRVQDLPWENRFDAAVLYDTLHHFDDERQTLRVLLRALVPGGRLYVREGVRPLPGSADEQHLIAEMQQYRTLESPFDPAYLRSVVEEVGFADVRQYVEVDELLGVRDFSRPLRLLGRLARIRLGLSRPDTNAIVATKPIPHGEEQHAFEACLTLAGPVAVAGDEIRVALTAENSGRAYWPAGGGFPYPEGTVNFGPYLLRDGERQELPRTQLPRSLGPGESATVVIVLPRAPLAGASELLIDMVREGIGWFSEPGAPPLRISPQA
ncbi:MAG: class I SAM-dependent methyltransferase [Actinomycetota bacterium]|nr:class I SAM-dependent methyltransferase [Actinomycetota bacterium]